MTKPKEEENILHDEILEDGSEEIRFEDKRRVDDSGERINVKINGDSENAEPEVPTKTAEVVRLENELGDISIRCAAAENKLIEVQKRFEEERENLENETVEMRARMKKSLEQQADQSRVKFLTSLLPVLDNLRLALQHAEQDASLENLIAGVSGTARSFENALTSVGVTPLVSIGEKFDPQLHEAVDMIETGEDQEGLVTAEYAKGYTFKESLLRPARVQVGTTSLK